MSLADRLDESIAGSLDALLDGVWDGRVDPELLEHCRRRVCALLSAPADAGRHHSAPEPAGPPDERAAACLAFAEMWVIDPHAVTDEQAAAVHSHLGDREAAAFTIGLATIEAQARTAIALEDTP